MIPSNYKKYYLDLPEGLFELIGAGFKKASKFENSITIRKAIDAWICMKFSLAMERFPLRFLRLVKLTKTLIYLDDTQIHFLQKVSKRKNVPVNELVLAIVNKFLPNILY
jgi:hypothetical protein